jgi:hypothetical protein
LEKNRTRFFPITQELHQLLKENSKDEKQYRRYVDSMKSSVLTAFYTPPEVIDAISSTLRDSGLHIDKFLEPSAGIGHSFNPFRKIKPKLPLMKRIAYRQNFKAALSRKQYPYKRF